ncbi:Hypothetical predicted protein [Paramuricea clavata]|uniref:Uncharacterized protein n=1 Tax=Paramuricea clavata TaxID=317549 RepID=A0A7D9K1F3_PARCT|nr:Hypothetical predicted protein [Paramuricea clavata]
MSTRTTLGLGTLVEETILKQSDQYKIKTKIKNTLQELTFIRKRFKLQLSDPSYKLRYQYALDFWREKTANEEIENIGVANNLINELREELNSKDCIYSEAEESNTNLDGFFSKETPTKAGKSATKPNSVEKPVWYVTSKCENKFYVKSANNCEAEIEINRQEILCSYKLICPGDEVKVILPCLGDKHSIQITKYVNGIYTVFTVILNI